MPRHLVVDHGSHVAASCGAPLVGVAALSTLWADEVTCAGCRTRVARYDVVAARVTVGGEELGPLPAAE